MHVQKLRGPPLKNLAGQKLQNLDRFYTTSHFDREYLRNETNQKSERHVISNGSSRVQPNKSGELWSTTHKVVHVSLDPPKLTFSTDYISAARGCWPIKFLHALDTGQGLLTHTANHVRGPPQILRANMVYHDIPWCTMVYHTMVRPCRNTSRSYHSLPYTMVYHGIPW